MIFLIKLIIVIVFVSSPVMVYMLKDILFIRTGKESRIFLSLSLIIANLLGLFFIEENYSYISIFINIPLLISSFKGYNLLSTYLIIVNICFYYIGLDYPILMLITEYLIYIIIFVVYSGKVKLFNLLSMIMIFKGFFTSFLYFYYDDLLIREESILYILVTVSSFYLIANVFFRLLEIKEEIKDRLLVSKSLDDTTRLRTYMFKITHEIKNPIAVCKGYLDMLNPNDIDKTVRYVNIIRSEMNRALTVLTDALDYDKIVVEKDIMDVVLLLEEVMDSYKELLKGKNIKLKYICKYEELFILGDYNRLKQVIVNLLKNAIEAKRAKEQLLITVKVKLDNNKINIIIKDNGIGMEEEVLNNIGVDFFTTKKTGSGLGVSISKDIIKKHDGELLYKSHKDDGTVAMVMLPNNCKL